MSDIRDGLSDRRRPDHERREFEPRRMNMTGDSLNNVQHRRRLTYQDRRKAQNSSQMRRQGPRDRRDLDFNPDEMSTATPFPDETTMRVITAKGILKAARLLKEMTPEPMFKPGEVVSMNQHNLDRLGGPMQEAHPYHRFHLSPKLPNNIIAIQMPGGFPGVRVILLTGEEG